MLNAHVARAKRDHAGRNVSQIREMRNQSQDERRFELLPRLQRPPGDALLQESLQPLNLVNNRFAQSLQGRQFTNVHLPAFQRFGEEIGRFDGVLNGVIDADSAYRLF
jgi:hypothetical protein